MAVVDTCRPASKFLRVGLVRTRWAPVRRPAAGPTSDRRRTLGAMPSVPAGAPGHACTAAACQWRQRRRRQAASARHTGTVQVRKVRGSRGMSGAPPLRHRRPCAASEVGGADGQAVPPKGATQRHAPRATCRRHMPSGQQGRLRCGSHLAGRSLFMYKQRQVRMQPNDGPTQPRSWLRRRVSSRTPVPRGEPRMPCARA
jgi:hypothetical protein